MTVDSSTATAGTRAGIARTPAPSSELGPWARSARCRRADPGLFFGSERERAVDREFREAKAVAICQACPVVAACRDWALANPSWADAGVWGATTESERASTRRRQQRDRLRAAGGAS